MRRGKSASARFIRGAAVILLFSGMFAAVSVPTTAQTADPGLIGVNEYESPQFDFTMAWDDPWTFVEGSATTQRSQLDKVEIESPGAFVQIILLFPTAEAQAYLDVLLENAEGSGTDYEEIEFDEGDGYLSATVEFLLTSGGSEFRVREYIEVGEIESANGRDIGLFTGSITARVDDFEAQWESALDGIERDGGNVLFLGEPEGIGSTTSRSVPDFDDDPIDEPEDDPIDVPTRTTASAGGINGERFTSPNFGFSVEWDDILWEAEDESTGSADALILISDDAEIEIRTSSTIGGDVRTCVTDKAESVKRQDGVRGFGRTTGYPLPEAPRGAFARLYDYTDTSGRRSVDYILYVECRPLEGNTYLQIVFLTPTDIYEDQLDNFIDVENTIEIGESLVLDDNGDDPIVDDPTPETTRRSPDLGRAGQRDDNTPIPDDDPTPEDDPVTSREPVLRGSTYTGGAFEYVIEWDDTIWSAEELEPEDGYEGVALTSDNGSAWIEAVTSFAGDPDVCVAAEMDNLEDLSSVTNVEEEDLLDLPRTSRGASVGLYSYTYTSQDGGTIDFIEYIECRELVEDESVLRVTLLTPYVIYEDEIPVWEDLLAGIAVGASGSSTSRSAPDTGSSSSGTTSSGSRGNLPGVTGNEYESPQFNFSMTWDATWEAIAATSEASGTTLTLSNDISLVIILAGEFPINPTECVETFAVIAGQAEGVTDFQPVTNDAGEPQMGGDRTFAYGLYSLLENDEVYFDYIRCDPAPNGDYVVAMIYQMPVSSFATELTALENLMRGILLE